MSLCSLPGSYEARFRKEGKQQFYQILTSILSGEVMDGHIPSIISELLIDKSVANEGHIGCHCCLMNCSNLMCGTFQCKLLLSTASQLPALSLNFPPFTSALSTEPLALVSCASQELFMLG